MRTEEATVGRKRRGMRCSEDTMTRTIDKRRLTSGVRPPKEEYEVFSLRGERTNCRIGEGFPPTPLVRTGSTGPNSKRCIEQKHTLVSPTPQTARCRYGNAKIIMQFLKDVLQRRRWRHAIAHRKTETFSLACTMIRILTEEHDFDFRKRTTIKGSKDFAGGRIAGACGIFGADKFGER